MRTLRTRLAPLIPTSLGRIPYACALRLTQRTATSCFGDKAQIWARNSYLKSSFRPLLSDLDMTLFLDLPPTASAITSWKTRISALRARFPLLGEINLALLSDTERFWNQSNPYELARDPQLCFTVQSRLGFALPNKTQHHWWTFFFRMLESDIESLSNSPDARRPKWQLHLSEVGLDCPTPLDLNSLIDTALRSWPEQLRLTIKRYFQERVLRQSVHVPSIDPLWTHFFPHRFCYLERPAVTMDPILENVFIDQMRWEIWGLAAQRFEFHGDNPMTLRTLEHLDRLLHWIKPNQSLVSSLRDLKTVIRAAPPHEIDPKKYPKNISQRQ